MKKFINDFQKIEIAFLLIGSILIISSGIIFKSNWLTIIVSIVSITAALCQAKRKVIGPLLGVMYTLMYAYVSYKNKYFGEVIINLGFALPMYLYGIISWKKHNNKKKDLVAINKIKCKEFISLLIIDLGLLLILFKILEYFETKQVIISTISMVINLNATYLLVRRSKFSYVLYMMNSILLFVLWGVSVFGGDYTLIPIMVNMSLLFLNNVYGFYMWNKAD